MVFEKMKNSGVKSFTLGGFSDGINAQSADDRLSRTELADSVNMWSEGGSLKVRPGTVGVFGCEIGENGDNISFIPTGSVIYSGGGALENMLVRRENDSLIDMKLLLVGSDRSARCINIHSMSKADYDDGDDINCLVFCDENTVGCGIYALIGIIRDKKVIESHIYELNTSLTVFSEISKYAMYTPLIYINGKGNKFKTLEKLDRTYPQPSKAEPMNMLNPAFRAAFKTDGVSDYFLLPVRPLDDKEGQSVQITYRDAELKEYNFYIYHGNDTSAAVEIDGNQITAKINRINGKVAFYCGGEVYHLPFIDGEYNNLIITAFKKNFDNTVFSMHRFQNYCGHIFLYGSELSPNKLYWSFGAKRMYFPENCCETVGDSFQNITYAAKQNNLMIVFKEHEIYYISGVKSNDYVIDDAIEGRVKSVDCRQSVSVNQLNGAVGCVNPETIRLCANRLVFLGSDLNVYALTSTAMSQKQVYLISKKISPLINNADANNAFAALYKGRYMLYIGGEFWLFDYNTAAFKNISSNLGDSNVRSLAWYKWKIDTHGGPFAGFAHNGRCFIISYLESDEGGVQIYITEIVGDNDRLLDGQNIVSEQPVCAYLKTGLYDFDSSCRKSVCCVEVEFDRNACDENAEVQLCMTDENGERALYPLKMMQGGVAKRRLNMNGVRKAGCYISSEGRIAVERLRFDFYPHI